MPRAASPKREREYKELKEEFQKEGLFKGKEDEVASRIVNKQRAQFGETKEQKTEARRGKSPDRNLPIENYDKLTIPQVMMRLDFLSSKDIKKVKNYESTHRNRKTLLEKLDAKICSL